MSGRSGGRDKKGAKEKPSTTQTTKTTDKLDPTATKAPQATPEQLRLAQIIHDPKRSDIPNIDQIIQDIKEATGSKEDDITVALHDHSYDVNKAVMALLEGGGQGEWKTSTKKMRKPPAQQQQSATSQAAETDSSESKPPDTDSGGVDKENKPENYSNRPMRERRSNNFMGPRLRRGAPQGDKRWLNTERQENRRNLAESGGGETSRGRGRRGRDRGQRGRGPRMFQNKQQRFETTGFPKSIDTWNNQITMDTFTATPWDESVTTPTTEEVWDAEEWDGAIESKVFTPSTAQASEVAASDHGTLSSVLGSSVSESLQTGIDLSTLLQKPAQSSHGGSDSYLPKPSAQDVYNSQATESLKAAIGVGQNSQSNSSFVSNSTYASSSREFSNSAYSNSSAYSGAYSTSPQYSAIHSDYAAPPTTATPQQPSYSSPATPQTNYSTTTTTQPISYTSSTAVSYTSATAPVSYSSPATPPASYSSSSSASTGTSQNSALPARKNKPRMTSSKIPSEAVEMPHDGIGELGMKLEGLAFGTATFNDISEPSFSSSSTSTTVSASTTSPASTYNTSTTSLTQHLNAALNQSAKVTAGESSLSSSFSNQNATESKVERSTPSYAGTSTSPKTSAPTESLSGYHATQSGSSNFHSSYSSQKPSAYHNAATAAAAAVSTYITQAQTSSSSNYTGVSSNSSFSSQQPGSYPNTQQQQQQQQNSASSSHYPSTQTSSSYTGGVSYSQAQSASTYSTAYQSGNNSGTTYQGTTQPQIYHSSANHYAATYSSGLAANQYSGSAYGVAQAPSQSSGALHPSKLNALTNVKDPQFDSTVSTTSQPAGGMSASSAFAFPTTGSTQTTKSITPTSKTGSIANVPAGIPTPLMGTHPFVVGQTTGYHLAAFPQVQQQVFPVDDLVLQAQRIPIAANSRDTNMAAYSVNDGVGGVKFGGRSVNAVPDTNTSSPGQTSTAQTQHQFIGHIPPFYYYPTMMPGNYPQYGTTPAVYPVNNVVTPASNTGVSNNQFQKTVTATAPFVQYNSYGESPEYSKAKNSLSHAPTQQPSSEISSVYRQKVTSLDKNAYAGMGTPPPGTPYGNAQYPMFIPAPMPNQQLMHLQTDSSSGNTQRATGTGQSSKPNTKQGYQGFSSWS